MRRNGWTEYFVAVFVEGPLGGYSACFIPLDTAGILPLRCISSLCIRLARGDSGGTGRVTEEGPCLTSHRRGRGQLRGDVFPPNHSSPPFERSYWFRLGQGVTGFRVAVQSWFPKDTSTICSRPLSFLVTVAEDKPRKSQTRPSSINEIRKDRYFRRSARTRTQYACPSST